MSDFRISLTVLTTLGAASLAGCYSAQDRVEIMVGTTPPGASCILSRLGQPIATAGPTPAIALVAPSDSEITILCRRRGYEDAAVALMAQTTGLGFDLTFSLPAVDDGRRVDLVLRAKPSVAPPSGR